MHLAKHTMDKVNTDEALEGVASTLLEDHDTPGNGNAKKDDDDNETCSFLPGTAENDTTWDTNQDETSSARTGQSSSTAIRPLKRARTAYFVFADERRPEVQAKHTGEGVAVHAKILGQMWAGMAAEEKHAYQLRAVEEREQVSKVIQSLRESGVLLDPTDSTGNRGMQRNMASATNNASDTSNELILPLSRIKKIIKLDPEVKGVSKEAMLLITRSAELFTDHLGSDAVKIAQIQNRRKLLPEDVAETCGTKDQYFFLRDDLRDLVRDQLEEKRTIKASKLQLQQHEKEGRTGENGTTVSTKPLTAYFGTASSRSS